MALAVILLGVRSIAPGWSGLEEASPQINFADEFEHQPLRGSAHSPDWTEFDRGPLTPRWPTVIAWTGQEIVIWGGSAFNNGQPLVDGAAYNPGAGVWRQLSQAPLAARSEMAWVWTDSELVIWSGDGQAEAWTAADNSWRVIHDWPLHNGPTIWTGHEIVDLRKAIAVDPANGEMRSISLPPGAGTGSGVVWTGSEILLLGLGAAYEPTSDTWGPLPGSGPARTSLAGVWTGELAVAVDYLMNSATYDPITTSWASLPDVPLRFSGCPPRMHGGGTIVAVDLCGDIGLLNRDRQGWTPVAPPDSDQGNTLIVAGDELYAWGEGFYRMNSRVALGTEMPRRVALGVSLLDLPEEWTFTSARLENPGRVVIEAAGPASSRCQAGSVRAVDQQGVIEHTTTDGGRSVWVATDADLIDISCNDSESVGLLAAGIVTP